MVKLIIVDDETLVQIGMKSMVDYEAMGIEMAGVAGNGAEALELIGQVHPQIVITDIKMPRMDGLELIDRCNAEMTPPPLFIVLTSYEEFDYVRRALRANVVDYLIKMELNAELLTAALRKALDSLAPQIPAAEEPVGDMFINRFLNQLLNYIYTDRDAVLQKAAEYGLDLVADGYAAAAVALDFSVFEERGHRENYTQYTAVMNMMEMALSKSPKGRYGRGYAVAYSETVIGVLFCFAREDDTEQICTQALSHMAKLSRKYFSIPLRTAVGPMVENPALLSRSFACAQELLGEAPADTVVFHPGTGPGEQGSQLDLAEINQGIIKALDTLDAELFVRTIERIALYLREAGVSLEKGIDSISSVVHLLIHNLDYGHQVLEDIFAETPRSYQAIYNCQSPEEMRAYLERLRDGIVAFLGQQKQSPKNSLVRAAQNYIRQHLYERVTLGDVARHIDVSPNYLSATFKKYAACGFNDYVTMQKMRLASQLLREGNLKVYQISEMLGFDSSYYFSTVYKKYTGMSPTETIAMTAGRTHDPEEAPPPGKAKK